MIRTALGIGAAGAVMLAASGGAAGEAARPGSADYPPNAKPGQCYAKVRTPPRYETYQQQVVVKPARRETRVVPGAYEWAEKRVVVSPERVERFTVPATYRTVHETVTVRPGGAHIEYQDAVYDTVAEMVMVRPAYTEWRRQYVGPHGVIPPGARIGPTGEVMCLVQVPAQYARVERRVLVQPAQRYQVVDPPVTKVVARQVVHRPAREVERVVPAVWRTQKVRRVVRPDRTEVVDIPAVTRSVTKQRLVSDGAVEWRRIDCPATASPPPPPPPPSAPPKSRRPGAEATPPAPYAAPGPEQPGPPPRMTAGERG